jgi:cation-transporting P-type ATPase 13A2
VKSEHLVPGDVIEVPSSVKMPCDMVLLTGSTVMNESMLTGESIPVIKIQLSRSEKQFDYEDKNHILYSGTECLQATAY